MVVKIYTEFGIRLLGESKAKVKDSFDPYYKNYVRLDSAVFGQTGYIPFINDPFHYFPPATSQIVYVSADGGDWNYPIAHGSVITGKESTSNLPANFKRNIPTCRGIFTPGMLQTNGQPVSLIGGHLLEFDDGEATFNDENAEPPSLTHGTVNKGVRLTTSGSNKLHIYEEETSGNKYNRVVIENTGGTGIYVIDSDDTISPKQCDGATACNSVRIGNKDSVSTYFLIRGDKLMALWNNLMSWLSTHTHGTGVGPSTVPLVPELTKFTTNYSIGGGILQLIDDVFSQKHKVE